MKYLSTFTGIGGFELGINKAYETKRNTNVSEKRRGQETEKRKLQKNGEGLHTISEQATLSTPNRNNELSNGSINERQPNCIGYSEINKYAIQIYQSKFPEHKNYGDITKINAKELPDFDLFVGGFPCQAFSIAGKRGGFDDTRGTLFFDCARILKEKQPRNFILENVKGLLSHDNGRTFKTIINTLVELGYCVEWQVLNAKNFGVPQNRERVFIVGHLGGIPERKVFPIRTDSTKTATVAGYISEEDWPNRHEQIKRVYNTDGAMPTIPTGQGGGVMTKIAIPVLTPDRLEKRQNGRRFKTDGEVAFTQTAQDRHGIFNGSRIRRLTPLECERLMGYPDGWTEGLSDTQRYKTLGNGIVSNVVEEVVKRLY